MKDMFWHYHKYIEHKNLQGRYDLSMNLFFFFEFSMHLIYLLKEVVENKNDA